MTSLTCEPIVSEKRRCHIVLWKFGTLRSLVSTCVIFLYFFPVSDIKTLWSQLWETRRNYHQRRDATQFCSSPNSRAGRCVCVCTCLYLSPSINDKRFVKRLNPWPSNWKIPWNLRKLVPAVPSHHNSAHRHTRTQQQQHGLPRPPSALSPRLLLCLRLWPYRSHELLPHARIHTP